MCHCNQCGSDWEPNARSGGNPVQCPRCKRVDWREPRKGVKNDELRGAGIGAVGAVVGSGNGAGVPVLPKAKGNGRITFAAQCGVNWWRECICQTTGTREYRAEKLSGPKVVYAARSDQGSGDKWRQTIRPIVRAEERTEFSLHAPKSNLKLLWSAFAIWGSSCRV